MFTFLSPVSRADNVLNNLSGKYIEMASLVTSSWPDVPVPLGGCSVLCRSAQLNWKMYKKIYIFNFDNLY